MSKVQPSPKQALRRYFKVFIPSMSAYTGFIFLAAYLIKNEHVSGPLLYAVAILPALAALAFLFGYFRFMRESDEFVQRVQVEATMYGVAAILTICLSWGILEMLIETLPKLPIFWIIPIYFAAQGLASWRLSKKYGTGFCLP